MQTLNGVTMDAVRRVLAAAQAAHIELILANPRSGPSSSIPLNAELAALWLLDRDQFWMKYHEIGPAQYAAWKTHIERADERGDVQCLSKTTKGRPCRNRFQMQRDAVRYDSAVDDHCKSHQEAYSDLHTGCPTKHSRRS